MIASMSGRAHPLDGILEEVIREEGGICPVSDIRDEIVASIEKTTAERLARGEENCPFCHLHIIGGVAVFTIVGDGLDIYVVRCPDKGQWELVNRFERLSRNDCAGYRDRLVNKYGKDQPDLLIQPDLAYDWLFAHRTEEIADGQRSTAGEPSAGVGRPTAEAIEPAESSVPPVQGDPMLEEMMAAVRAAGGGKGNKVLRLTDLG
jgi:hypothetical protein